MTTAGVKLQHRGSMRSDRRTCTPVHAYAPRSSRWRRRGGLTRDSSEPSGKVDPSAGAAGPAAIVDEGSQWHALKASPLARA